MTAADKYYLKAKDSYPYEMNEALEALEYGLSYDDTHAGLLTLRGEICYKDLKQFDAAAASFSLALYHDEGFVNAYYSYLDMLIITDDVRPAELLIAKALGVKGIDKGRIWHMEALLYEKQAMFTLALASIANARLWCSDEDDNELYAKEKKRIKKKMALMNKTGSEPEAEQPCAQGGEVSA